MGTRTSGFGWFGLTALLVLCVFTFDNSQRALTMLPDRISTPMLIMIMVASIVLPLVEALRSSKRWMLISALGFAVTLRFFWILAD